jgi:hypothetical protein
MLSFDYLATVIFKSAVLFDVLSAVWNVKLKLRHNVVGSASNLTNSDYNEYPLNFPNCSWGKLQECLWPTAVTLLGLSDSRHTYIIYTVCH